MAYIDLNKHEWILEIQTRTIKEIKKNVRDADGQPVDLMACINGNLTFKLLTDPCLLIDILWQTCKPYADAKGVTYETFCQAHRGDVLDDALDAFMEALENFFPKRLRAGLAQMYQATKELQDLALTAALTTMDNSKAAIQPVRTDAIQENVRKQQRAEYGN